MRAIGTDTGESSLIGQDCCQELNRICKGAEEQLSGSWVPLAGGRCWTGWKKTADQGTSLSPAWWWPGLARINVITPHVHACGCRRLFNGPPASLLLQPTALGTVVQTINPLGAAAHYLQAQALSEPGRDFGVLLKKVWGSTTEPWYPRWRVSLSMGLVDVPTW